MPAFIRPQFCEGRGPFRWVALSGDPADILRTDRAVLELFPDDAGLRRWIEMAEARVPFQGLPARICWLGYGERARAGLAFNELVRTGEVSAPIVIGRDHLDSGSVASPNRETEAMADGSDAVADWPLLNALVNTAAGATWVSIHHGGGVGIGYSQHAGMVVVADGSPLAAQKLERVLTTDPAMGVLRHADAGYERAIEVARERGVPRPDARRSGRLRSTRSTSPRRAFARASIAAVLIESVPNVSEGRRLDVVDRLAAAIEAVPGVYLLDRTSDASHNRSVFTLAGEHGPVTDALERLVAAAIHEIDMNAHVGEHPRIGAVDVIPFVPLAATTMDDCIELARAFGGADRDALSTCRSTSTRTPRPGRNGSSSPMSGAASTKASSSKSASTAASPTSVRRVSTPRPARSPSAPGRS